MSTGVDSLGFTYALDVARLTGPAADAARALGLLNKGLGSVAAALAKIESSPSAGLGRVAKEVERATSATVKWGHTTEQAGRTTASTGRHIAAEWERMAAAAEKAEHRKTSALERAHSAAIAIDQRRTASSEKESARRIATAEREAAAGARAAERESERRGAAADREMQRELRSANRISAARAKASERATEKASHKYYFGGEKSFGGLVQSRHEGQVSGLASSLADRLTPLGMLGTAGDLAGGAFNAVGTVVSAGASLAYHFGKMAISAQAMREESVEGFNAIFKSTTAGDKLFDSAREIAKHTKFETPQVIARFNALGGRGFGEDQIQRVYSTISDVETGRGPREGFKAAQRYQNSLANLNSRERPVFVTFQQGADASGGLKLAEQALGSRLGIKETGGKLDEKLRQMFKDKKISGNDAMEALIAGTNARYNPGGKEGDFAAKQGDKTWTGVISNIKSGVGDILNMKLPEDHAINKFKKILQDIGSKGGLFDATGGPDSIGVRFQSLISKFVEDIFMPFGGKNLQDTGSVMGNILQAGELVEKKFHKMMEDITKGINDSFADKDNTLGSLAAKVGISIGGGIMKGIMSEMPGARYSSMAQGSSEKAWSNLGSDAFGWVGSLLAPSMPSMIPPGGSHGSGGEIGGGPYGSPVLTMMHVGEIVPGLHGENMQQVNRAYGGGGGAGTTIHLTQHIYGGDDLANEVVRMFEMAVRSPSAASTPG